MNIVIYARYSSHSQTEQSIEGQLQACYDYAKANGHIVAGEYIDRTQSGTTDSCAEFQRMIADSNKHFFEAVLVYQLDRFARNRYDSAINKAKLKKECHKLLTEKNIQRLAKAVADATAADYDSSTSSGSRIHSRKPKQPLKISEKRWSAASRWI